MRRADELFEQHHGSIACRTDKMFAILMGLEYLAGIIVALVVSPKTWSGTQSSVHVHVWLAAVLGAVILSLPIALAIFAPGKTITRHTVAVGQMIFSGLLVHLTGGRIETHFHIFGSLAFLGFYRDWKVLVSASAVVAIDHFFRGAYRPESVFGTSSLDSYRWLEHTGWVVFEDIFIALASYQSIKEMKEIAEKRAFIENVAQERATYITELQDTKESLKRALQSKNDFISICGHELKTPITSLSLQTQLSKKALSDGSLLKSPVRVEKLIYQTDIQMKRLLHLVEDMLEHSRLQTSKMPLVASKIDICKLVKQVIDQCQVQADNARCSIWFEGEESIIGSFDAFRIEQVVTNLLTNAIKYGVGKPIEVIISKKQNALFISVKDHGIGIAEENYSKVFQQFVRIPESSHYPGLGLGLFISNNIILQHGGQIHVSSKLGIGSTFTIELPLQSQELKFSCAQL